MLQAIIFDMDGVLIDSEPYWHEAEIESFAALGITLTDADCFETTGMRIHEVTRYRYDRTPWVGKSADALAEEILDGVIRRVRERGMPMRGLADAMAAVRATGLPLGLASSSSSRLIDAVLDKLGLRTAFHVVASAEEEREGKPAPDVYLTAARVLGVDATKCLAIEDSVRGLRAARAAGMACIVIPAEGQRTQPGFAPADWILNSLTELDSKLLNQISDSLK